MPTKVTLQIKNNCLKVKHAESNSQLPFKSDDRLIWNTSHIFIVYKMIQIFCIVEIMNCDVLLMSVIKLQYFFFMFVNLSIFSTPIYVMCCLFCFIYSLVAIIRNNFGYLFFRMIEAAIWCIIMSFDFFSLSLFCNVLNTTQTEFLLHAFIVTNICFMLHVYEYVKLCCYTHKEEEQKKKENPANKWNMDVLSFQSIVWTTLDTYQIYRRISFFSWTLYLCFSYWHVLFCGCLMVVSHNDTHSQASVTKKNTHTERICY